MARAGAGRRWTLRAPSVKAGKGVGASKRQIGRCFHHGQPDVEERSIERSVRQEGKREVAHQLDEVGHDAEVSVVAPPVIAAPVTAKDAPVTDAPPACPRCGSERSGKGDGGACRDEGGCRTRRCRRRHDESSRVRRERRLSQCPSITGSVRSIRFCTMHQGHDGLHLNGATEWDDSGELRDGFAVALADATRGGRVSS